MTSRFKDFINTRFLHPTSTGISNIPSLDGIRGVAIIMVVYCHYFIYAGGNADASTRPVLGFGIDQFLREGGFGVRLFFVLSAFLLFLPYIRYHVYSGTKPSVSGFFKRRVLRILPAFYFILALYASLILVVGREPDTGNLTVLNALLNAAMVQPFFLYVSHVSADLLPGTWSLATEVHFYLLLPFIARWFTSIRRALALTLLSLVFCAVYRAGIGYLFEGNARLALGYNIFAHFDLFALGMLAALLYFKKAAGEIRLTKPFSYIMIGTGMFLYWWMSHGGMRYIVDVEIIAGLSFFLIIFGVVSEDTVIRRVLAWSPLRFIGLISYSMFLMNLIVVWYLLDPMQAALGIVQPVNRFAFNMSVGVLVLIVLSTISYLYVERPFLVRKVVAPSGLEIERASVEVTPPMTGG